MRSDSIIQPQLDRALAGEAVSYTRKTDFPARGTRHVEVALLPVRNARGEITGAVMRAQDVQETRAREAQLQQTVALLEQRTMEQERFIHIISHDLREPINTVNNFTSLLVSDHQEELLARCAALPLVRAVRRPAHELPARRPAALRAPGQPRRATAPGGDQPFDAADREWISHPPWPAWTVVSNTAPSPR